MGDQVLSGEPNLIADLPGFKAVEASSVRHPLHSQVMACEGFFADLLEVLDAFCCGGDR